MSSQLPTALLASVVTLGLVVIVHELGHFLFCKMFGIYVKTFSIGMGPKLLRWKRGETEYVLSAVPFGGYVKMAGEGMMEEIQDTGTWEERKYPLGTAEGNREAAALDEDIPAHRLFSSRPVWQRLLVFIAGPLFNLVLAWIIYTGMMTVEGVRLEPFTRVGSVEAGSPAALAGIAVGDSITAVGGKAVATWDDVLANVLAGIPSGAKTAPAVPLTVIRDGAPVDLAMTPVVDDSTGRWHLGMDTWNTAVGRVQKEGPADRLGLREGDVIVEVAGRQVTSFAAVAGVINESAGEPVALRWRRGAQLLSGTVTPELNEVAPGRSVGRIFYEPYYTYERLSLGKAVVVGWKQTVGMVRMMIVELGKLVGRKHGLDAVGGPLRIGKAAGEMLRWGVEYLAYYIALFSVNLFLLNLLPIPVLDGGHVLFLLIEAVRGKPAPERLQAIATQIGLIALLLFMVFVLVLDAWKLTGH